MKQQKATLGNAGSKKKTRLQELVNNNFDKMLSDVVNPRLVKVEEMVNSDMKTQSENVHTLQQEMEKIMNDFRLQAYNIDLTIMAMLEILEESEIKIADFSKRVGERKREIDQKLIDAVEADKKAKVEAESVAALEKQPEAPVAS